MKQRLRYVKMILHLRPMAVFISILHLTVHHKSPYANDHTSDLCLIVTFLQRPYGMGTKETA